MRPILAVLLALLSFTAAGQYRPLETRDESRQRHNAERYETYRDRGNQAPLGGYRERLGDPAPRDTESPGFNTSPRPTYRDRSDERSTSDSLRGGGFNEPVDPRRRP